MTDETYVGDEIDVYNNSEDLIDNGELSSAEAGFMVGYKAGGEKDEVR